jgi:predicted RNA binding protein YcfA (HicA-like mRNA interferase family)
VTWNELIRKIERAGWKLERTAGGSHRIYGHAKHSHKLVIAYHANSEVSRGLANDLLRKAGVK